MNGPCDFIESIQKRVLEPRKKRARTIPDGEFGKLRTEAIALASEGRWSGASARHFVAHYAHLHARLYGIEAAELDPATRYKAARLVEHLLDKEFGGDRDLLASFCRWLWTRERSRHEFQKANNRPLTRLTWNAAFSAYKITDWRLNAGGR